MTKRRPQLCPCGTGDNYQDCCRPLHSGDRAPTPEALMRSRYCAFALGDSDYLSRTWHPDTRPASLHLDSATKWTKLEILGAEGGSNFHTSGTVSFRAHYVRNGQPGVQTETSRFTRVDGAWRYLAAVTDAGLVGA